MRNAPVGILPSDLGVMAVHRVAARKPNEVDVESVRGAADDVGPIASEPEADWPFASVADQQRFTVPEHREIATAAFVAQLRIARQQCPAARVHAAQLERKRLRLRRHLTQSSRSVSLTPPV